MIRNYKKYETHMEFTPEMYHKFDSRWLTFKNYMETHYGDEYKEWSLKYYNINFESHFELYFKNKDDAIRFKLES